MVTQLAYHFNSFKWCNPMGWKHNSGICIEAVETVGEGTPSATKLFTQTGSPSTLFIDTQYTCEPRALTETCKQVNLNYFMCGEVPLKSVLLAF